MSEIAPVDKEDCREGVGIDNELGCEIVFVAFPSCVDDKGSVVVTVVPVGLIVCRKMSRAGTRRSLTFVSSSLMTAIVPSSVVGRAFSFFSGFSFTAFAAPSMSATLLPFRIP